MDGSFGVKSLILAPKRLMGKEEDVFSIGENPC